MGAGTMDYMAPEVASGEYDAKADVYALGKISMEMIRGRDALGAMITLFTRCTSVLARERPTAVAFLRELRALMVRRACARCHSRAYFAARSSGRAECARSVRTTPHARHVTCAETCVARGLPRQCLCRRSCRRQRGGTLCGRRSRRASGDVERVL